jgi:2-keto-4-pentenoate hydratase/2-oxohepta-3-ene-1,7-dioic acid hydratase in catechol pathway
VRIARVEFDADAETEAVSPARTHRRERDVRLVAGTSDPRFVLDLRAAAYADLVSSGATCERAATLAQAVFPPSLTALLGNGDLVLNWMERLVSKPAEEALRRVAAARFLSPADPPMYRDFAAFDEHAVNTWRRANREPPRVTRELPIFFKGSTATLIGHDAVVPWPHYAEWLDYELELGVVIKRITRDADPEVALNSVFGLTMLNDFSARDMQFREMTGRLGPAKGKDFATAVGPWVVTLDELNLADLKMAARVNGDEWSLGNVRDAMWSFGELIAWASVCEVLLPGDLLGTGTVGGGSGLELERRLDAGDTIELEGDGIGILRNTIGRQAATGYTPEPKKGTTT